MENSAISWCDHTQNFWIGCTKVSPGCANCYAETLDRNRFSRTLDGGTKEAPVSHWGPGAPRFRTSAENWKKPLRWDKLAKAGHFVEIVRSGRIIARGDVRRLVKKKDAAGAWLVQEGDKVFKVRPRVFCSSLSDILDAEVDPKTLAEALDIIRRCDGLDWLLVTKRPELWRERITAALEATDPFSHLAVWLRQWLEGTVRNNVWFGATMEDQPRYDQRWRQLAAIPARYRFISMEPMLGAIDMLPSMPRHAGAEGTQSFNCPFQWVIVGGESGDKARPMHPDWARSIRDQCATLGVAFHFKQWGSFAPGFDEDRYTHGEGEKKHHIWITRSGESGACWIRDDDGTWDNFTGNPPLGADGNVTDEVAVMHPSSKSAAGHLLDAEERRAFPNDPCPRDHDRDGNCDRCATAGGCLYGKGGPDAR